jgi:hypothetical protein
VKVCEVDGCEKARANRGRMCAMHRNRLSRHGDTGITLRARRSPQEVWSEDRSMRKCSSCGAWKIADVANFPFLGQLPGPRCRPCDKEPGQRRNKAAMLKKYGLTEERYAEMLASGCQLCGVRDGLVGKNGRLHIDHDHNSGNVRGVLCHHCNTGIGKLKEDPALLWRAIQYLVEHGKPCPAEVDSGLIQRASVANASTTGPTLISNHETMKAA